ncbi:maltose O-acetyltransferase [Globomyces pollinis-pini]|nr:maltose O-acetyltransferase [Globomyces pollinis-pini]
MKSEKEKMIDGEHYNPLDVTLVKDRLQIRQHLSKFNNAPYEFIQNPETRRDLLMPMFPNCSGHIDSLFIEPPFRCDYGYNIKTGSDVYFNFGCIVLDVCKVNIGSRVLFGPNVQIYTASHPLEAELRVGPNSFEFGKPITIGNDVWVGGSVVLCPGITIVVTKDVPDNCVFVGNPAKLLKKIDNKT